MGRVASRTLVARMMRWRTGDALRHHPRHACGDYSLHRAERNARASTTSHPTITNEAIVPAAILVFSFVVYPRMQCLTLVDSNDRTTQHSL
jgi:hypothetical protein